MESEETAVSATQAQPDTTNTADNEAEAAEPSAVPEGGATQQAGAAGEKKDAEAKKDAEEKDGGAEDKGDVVPETYDLHLSEGTKLTKEHLAEVELEAKASGMTQGEAEGLLEAWEFFADKQAESFERKKTEWAAAAKKDKEYGGDGFNGNIETAKRFITKYANKDFQALLEKTGLGSHPEMIRFAYRAGKAMANDAVVLSGSSAKKPFEPQNTTLYNPELRANYAPNKKP